jgi:SAM-dependent methyltransferase
MRHGDLSAGSAPCRGTCSPTLIGSSALPSASDAAKIAFRIAHRQKIRMDSTTYAIEAEVEATHWWFTERRWLFGRLIAAFALSRDAHILDIGTSTGTNLRMLRELGFSRYEGLDASAEAVQWCAQKGYGKVTQGDVCNLPFADGSFDLVLATDIIEHVDDLAALREIRRVLAPQGRVLITVPAFMSLWGRQDEVGQHKRRYRGGELRRRVEAAGLRARRRFYFNYLLFLPILLVRTIVRRARVKVANENELNSPLLNRILRAVFRIDVWSAPFLHPPFGVSYLLIAARD